MVQPGAGAVLVWKPLDFNHCVLQVMLSCRDLLHALGQFPFGKECLGILPEKLEEESGFWAPLLRLLLWSGADKQ